MRSRFSPLAFALLLLLGLPLSLRAGITVVEGQNGQGDLPNSAAAVTLFSGSFVLSAGSNTFQGTAGAAGDPADFFAVAIPRGMVVTAITTIGSGTFTVPTAPLYFGAYTCGFTPAAGQPRGWGISFTVAAAPDYDVTTTGGQIVVFNRSSNGDTLTFSEVSAGNVQFAAPNRTFSVNGGSYLTGSSGTVSLNGISGITINGGEGGETINVGDFNSTSLTTGFPSLTINGGAGNDTVNFTGRILFLGTGDLTVNLQASGPSPGADDINVTGSGAVLSVEERVINLKCSRSVSITGGAHVAVSDGDLTIAANQQATPTPGNFTGVNVDGAGSKVSVSGPGTLTVNGRGGNDASGSQLGVNVSGGAMIKGDGGPVTVTGAGGASTGQVNRGVTVYGAGSAITSTPSTGGDVNVIGTGGANGSAFGIGVSVLYGGSISAAQNDSISYVSVTGTGQGAAGSGSNQGVEIAGAASPASAVTGTQGVGNVTITAIAGPGASSGLLMSDSAAVSDAVGDVFITSDSVSLDATATIGTNAANSGIGVYLSTRTATHINLGGADAAGTLGLSTAELARITTAKLTISGVANGDITTSAAISPGTKIPNLALAPGTGGLTATFTGHDFTVSGTVFFNGPINMPITGASAFPQVNMSGGVNLGGSATLNLAGTTFAGSLGQKFTILVNFSNAPITGTFANLPEGALLTWPGSSAFLAQISYVGGGGHDIVLTLISSAPTVTNNADSGTGSLRAILAVAAFRGGADTVTFDPSLTGQTIALSSELLIKDTAGVTIDASGLPGGLTLTSANSRVFEVASGSRATLRALTIANGKDTSGIGGGAVFNNGGSVTLAQCTVSGNQAINGAGGGNEGGALYNAGSSAMTVTQCTLAGNVAPGANSLGGVLYNLGTATLSQCTLSGNSAGNGGGIVNFNSLTLTNSIVGGNTLTSANGAGPDIFNNNVLTATGENLVGTAIVNNGSVNGSSGPVNSPAILTASPMLATLGSYGGPTRTMPPLRGSLAIDGGSNAAIPNDPATGAPFTVDQRGLPRINSGFVDIGAAETSVFVVTNNFDDGSPGSLRQQIAFATDATNTITFASNLAGSTIQFTAASGQLTLANNVAIDASALTGGITLNGGGTGGNYRLLAILPGTSVVLRNLVFANGGGNAFTGQGGAVANSGTATVSQCVFLTNSLANSGNGGAIINISGASMTLNACSFTGNRVSSTAGGAISNDGTMTLNVSTLNANSAVSGGAILNNGALTLNQCTLAGNTVSSQGGAIYSGAGTLNVTQSTVSANAAGNGGGICNAGGTLTSTNSIFAQNTGAPGADINNTATVARVGRNIVGSNDTVATTFAVGNPNGNGDYAGTPASPLNALLAPLGNYGGPTLTMALEPGTPAHNASVNSPFTTDQRGFPLVGPADIGAYEAGTLTNFNAFIYETLPATATVAQHAAGFDFDGDGVSNLAEFLDGTNAADATSSLHLTGLARANGVVSITFPTVSGHVYVVQASPSLTSPTWSDIGSVGPTDTSLRTVSFRDPAPDGTPAYFYRVRLGP